MSFKVTVKVEDDRVLWDLIMKRARNAGGHVDVGFFGADDAEMPMIAAVQEFGNKDNRMYNPDGNPAPIPERPFMRQTYNKYLKEIELFIDRQLDRYVKLKISYEQVFERTGLYFQRLVRKEMKNSSNWEKNSDVTIERKGSSKPLFDTGTMWQTLTYLINKKFGESGINL